MDSRTLNRYQMVLSVQNFLDTNNATWSAIPIMNTFKGNMDDLILGTKEELKSTGKTSKGITIGKTILRSKFLLRPLYCQGCCRRMLP